MKVFASLLLVLLSQMRVNACTWNEIPSQYESFGIKSHFVGKLTARMELLDQNEQRQMLRGKFDPVFQVHGQWNSSQWLDFPKYVHSSELITDRYYVIYVGKNNDFVDPCGYHLRLESSASIENDAFEDYKKWIIALHDKHKKEMQMELLRSVEPQSK